MRVKRYYTFRRVATQGNAGGGAVVIDISPATGQELVLENLGVVNSGNNGLRFLLVDEDNATYTYLGEVAAAAGTRAYLPSVGTVASAANYMETKDMKILPGQKLTLMQTAAGAQNDTFTVAGTFRLKGSGADPSWSKARSTNEADVALAASTIGTTPNPEIKEAA